VGVETYRTVVTDLDGTIVDKSAISGATIDAAADLRRRGVPLVVATARTPVSVGTLEQLLPYFDIAVCCGGAFGWAPTTGSVLWRDDIPDTTVEQTVAVITDRWPDAGVAAYDGTRWLMTEAYAGRRWTKRKGATEVVPVSEFTRQPVCAMSICHPRHSSQEMLDVLAAADIDPPPSLNYGAANLLDVVPGGIDKGTGVRRALAALGVDASEAIAFGDMPNDLPMFAVCGRSVAMGNALPEVLAAATMVTESVEGDGFAKMLTRLGIVGSQPVEV
jgi:Cof subfamily protein (haloacid dehalogenase superfamily)